MIATYGSYEQIRINMQESTPYPSLVMLPASTIEKMQEQQARILKALEGFTPSSEPKYLTAAEFMDKVSICRATFDQLRSENKIKVIKKGRKIYLPSNAVEKYFTEQ